MSWIGRWKRIEDIAGEYLAAQEKDKTHGNIAILLETTPKKVSIWSKGKPPEFDDLVKIAQLLGLSPRWLLFGEGEPQDF